MSSSDLWWLIGVLLTVVGALILWLRQVYNSKFDSICSRVDEHERKIQDLEILVAGDYITRLDAEKLVDVVFKKLDELFRQQRKVLEDVNEIKINCAKNCRQ